MSPLSVTDGITQEGTDRQTTRLSDTSPPPSPPRITGPHDGRNSDGSLDHRYWRCERCGFESADPRLREGCFHCDRPRDDAFGTTGGDDAE